MPVMSLPANDDEVLLIHNPACSKSRATRALLEERGLDAHERLYLEEPLTRDELADLARRLGRPVREWVRRGEAAFREAGLADVTDDGPLLDALAAHPGLLERPIVVRGERAAVGRPPAAVLELFDE